MPKDPLKAQCDALKTNLTQIVIDGRALNTRRLALKQVKKVNRDAAWNHRAGVYFDDLHKWKARVTAAEAAIRNATPKLNAARQLPESAGACTYQADMMGRVSRSLNEGYA